jgi:hypothetical protein
LGAVVAADVRISTGEVLLDQSMLTGESVPIEAGAGVQTFAGALVRRGEAVAEVATLSVTGIEMSPLPVLTVIAALVCAAAFAVVIDFVKVPAFRRLAIT